jgi:phage-related protein
MPKIEIKIFAEEDGAVPFLEWMDQLPAKVQDKCIVRIELSAEKGYELRRPLADFLRDGIYELRVSRQGIHNRILYFFHGKQAVISHGLTKTCQVPPKEIDLALKRKICFGKDQDRHTYRG